MKSLILSFLLLASTSAFAGSPFAVVKCKSDVISLESFTEGCTGAFKLKEIGKNDVNVAMTCSDFDLDKFTFEINMTGNKNPLQVTARNGSDNYVFLGYDVQLQNDEAKPTDVKHYLMKADLYRLSSDKTQSAAHKALACEVETFLLD